MDASNPDAGAFILANSRRPVFRSTLSTTSAPSPAIVAGELG